MTQDELKLELKAHEVMLLSCYILLGIQELQFLSWNPTGKFPHKKQSSYVSIASGYKKM